MKTMLYEQNLYDRSHGWVFRYCRGRLGFNQTVMAGLLGMHQSALSRLEKGKRLPTPYQIMNLEKLMGKSYHQILQGLKNK